MTIPWSRRARERLSNEVLPLVLLRALVILASFSWLVFAPPGLERPGLVAAILAAFAAYSIGLFVLLWVRVGAVLRWNLLVLSADLVFALAIIRFTGGARSVFFIAFYLIVALESYYYGIRRGVAVAVAATLLYLAVAWPTLAPGEWANYALREGVLILTAIGLGVISKLEREERREIVGLNEELRSRERFVRDVTASLRDGVVTLDRERRVRGWNRTMEVRHGSAASEVRGRSFFDVFPGLGGEGLAAAVERIYEGADDGFTLEGIQYQSPGTGRVVLNFKGSAIRGTDGALQGVILFVEDVTERIALEHSLRQAEKLAGLGTLAAGLAHEINNPIGVITSRSELMLEEADAQGLPEQLQEDLGVIRNHAHRIARITHGLLSFARHRPGEKVPVDLNRVVEDTLLLAGHRVEGDGVVLRLELARGLPPVEGDPTLLGQVVLNLVQNARGALSEGGEISVRTEADPTSPERVRLLVRDTGPGIPEDQLGRIFEPFFTTKPTGTGLGLAMCYGIVREHKGLIGVESRPGEGTTFTLSLPGANTAGTKVGV